MPEAEENKGATAAETQASPAESVASATEKPAESTAQGEEQTLLGKEEGKPEERPAEVKPEVVVPEKYDLKVPEGMTLDQAMLDKISPVFKELKISQEGAQRLADVYAPYIKEMVEQSRTTAVGEFNKMVGDWKAETTKELSKDGAKSEQELAHAAKFIDKFGGPELRQVLNETGLGNHIALVKAFIKAGKAIANDSFPDSTKRDVKDDSEEAKAKRMFPSMPK